jgi:DNA-binding NarL/FixJ family response regulator
VSSAFPPSRVRVVVAEPWAHLRSVLGWVLAHDPRFEVVALLEDGRSAAELAAPYDLALLDLGTSGLEHGTLEQLARRAPPAAAVILAHADVPYLRAAAAARGAAGYLVGPDVLEELPERLAAFGLSR